MSSALDSNVQTFEPLEHPELDKFQVTSNKNGLECNPEIALHKLKAGAALTRYIKLILLPSAQAR